MAQVVDAATVFPYPFNMPVSRQTLREFRCASQDLGLLLLVHGPIWELYTASIHPQIHALGVEMVKRAIDFAVQIDAVHITLHPGPKRWPDVWPQLQRQALDAQLRAFIEIGEYAAQVGIQVGIENMLPGENCLTGYDDFAEIYRVLDCQLHMGVTLDVGHVEILKQSSVRIIHRLGKRLNHLHIHDNHGEWDEHLPVGEGVIAWEPVCRALLEMDYSGVLEIERSLPDGGVESSIAVLKGYLGIEGT
jgi:sugar phosphate isomerase/epimerase